LSTMPEPTESGQRRHPLAHCEECDLNEPSSIFVPSVFPDEKCAVAIIGEAPGYQEAAEGRPFAGASGKLLDVVLDGSRVDRSTAFVSNVCLCRPPGNITPSKRAVKACLPRLTAELDQLNVECMVTLGNVASQAILKTSEGITTLRAGPPKHHDDWPNTRIIPTIHPAYCLRVADAFPLLCTDIGKVHHAATISWEAPTYRSFDRVTDARRAVRELSSRSGPICIDIEVGYEKDTDFEHPDQYRLLCIGLGYEPGKVAILGEPVLGDAYIRAHLAGILRDRPIIAHNGKFDLAGLSRYAVGKLWFDTMLASYCENEMPGTHGLKYLAREILGAPQYDLALKRHVAKGENFANVPVGLLHQYNAYDVACTYDLYRHYSKNADADSTRLQRFLCSASDQLMAIEMEGIGVDGAYLQELTESYLDDLDAVEGRLTSIVGDAYFNPRSPKQVKEYLLSEGISTDTTNEARLVKLIEQRRAIEFCEEMLVHRREQKLYGTYVKGIHKRLYHDRVFPTFLLHGTVSGRLACRNPNMQNVPRESKIRRLFVPAEGNVFVQGDYAQAELRVMATLSRDTYLRDVFNEGRNIHEEVATQFFGPKFSKDQYIRAKAVVFGLAYGREAYSLAEEFRIPVSEAQRYLRTFFEAIPQLAEWRRTVQSRVADDHEDLVTPFGRHRRFWLITRENKKDILKEALSFYPQSIASDINLSALIRLKQQGLHVRLPVHDSILVECAAEDVTEVANKVKTVMEETAKEVFDDYITFPADIAVGSSWGNLE
jgi:DNA polymerase-1